MRAPTLQAAIKIVIERCPIRVAGPRPSHLLFLGVERPLGVTRRIRVPRGKIEGFAIFIMVEFEKMLHVVVRDPATWGELSQNSYLVHLKISYGVAGEPVEVKHVRGVWI